MAMNPTEMMQHNADILSAFIAPILVYERGETNAAKWITGGTAFFARTADTRFLVTADHIYKEIDDQRLEREVVLFLGGRDCQPINISDWPILDRDDYSDICTVKVPVSFDESILGKRFFELVNWPHERATQGNAAFIIGYPGAHRTGTDTSVNIRIAPICDFVTDVGPRKFTVADESEEREVLLNSENLDVPEHFGGMSGSPAFRIGENERPEFIGIFSTGSGGLRGAFFCSHADFILPDGRLDFRKIPPP